ncbi:MAG: hypothetical protein KDA60_19635, partial [Planctomycetales bacterium]|nr:hypothetical protein [Planctomycetales bacterium]
EAELGTPLQLDLMPVQRTGPDGDDPTEPPPAEYFADPPGFEIDPEVYGRDEFYPQQLGKVTPMGMLRDLEVVLVEIATAQYNAVAGVLNPFTHVDVHVSFSGGEEGFLPENALSPFENASALYATILNADVLGTYYPGTSAEVTGEEYLILTHPDFRPAADALAAWKNTKGIMTRVFEVGEGTARDSKEEIHALIEDHWYDRIVRPSYVLLLGDTDFIPTWYRSTHYAGGLGGPNWDEDQNVYQGQWVSLGSMEFLGNGGEFIELARLPRDQEITDPGATSADAVKFVNLATNAEVIVDNQDPEFSILSGTWNESITVDEFQGSSLYSQDDGATVRFTPDLPGDGHYQVFAWWSGQLDGNKRVMRDSQARYRIVAAGTATDTPYSYVSGGMFDILPDLAAGRIPVETVEEAMGVVSKIIAYEQTPPGSPTDGEFYHTASVVAQFEGYRDPAPLGHDNRTFVEGSEQARDALMDTGKLVERIYTLTEEEGEAAYIPNRYYGGDLLPLDLRAGSGFDWDGNTDDVLQAFAEGRFLITHRDHGWRDGWAHPGFTTWDVDELDNGPLTPVVYSINCSSGAFDVYGVHFAEELIRNPNGGAVAFIGSTRDSNTWSNTAFYRGLIDATWTELDSNYGSLIRIRRVGDILNYAKEYAIVSIGAPAAGPSTDTPDVGIAFAVDTIYLFHVLGDPTLEMWTANPHIEFLPPDATVEEALPFRLTVGYGVDGATITASQERNGERVPLGRGVVVEGRVVLDLVTEADLDQPIILAASTVDAVSQELTVAMDFGDAPDGPYPTLLANDGARHRIRQGFHLGTGIDDEADGLPHPLASGDDVSGSDDEDGLTFSKYLIGGQTTDLELVSSAEGVVNIWLDLDQDGLWEDGEQIFVDRSLRRGVNTLSYDV